MATPEAILLRGIELALGAIPSVIVLRNTVGRVRLMTTNGHERTISYGLGKGSPDLICLVRPGRVLGLEVKAEDGRVSAAQTRCHAAWWNVARVPVVVVRSVAEAQVALEQVRMREVA